MDDGHIWGELLIIILLVLANGACSLAEIAIVGARKTKLQEMIDAGSKNAVYALRLAEKKEELFSTIQVGITTISIITGMFSGASLAGPLGRELEKIPFLAPSAHGVSMVTVMVLVTSFDYRRARPEMGRDRHSGDSSLRHCKADDPSCDRLPSARAFLHVVDESRRQSNRRENGR